MVESEAQKSPCAQRFLRSNTASSSSTPNNGTSSENVVIDANSKIEKKNLLNVESPFEAKRSVSIMKNSITPPISTSTTPQRVRRSQSLSSKQTSSLFSDFEKSCLKAHNEFRNKHDVQPLKLNKRLCRFSEEWAKVRVEKLSLSFIAI